ncbi:E3 ubiquitin-protein ligase TRIM71-like [Saccostrea echinata]|uniref:E3 ubiquitin-protein ligase TRIM71-like n=1 Tax=Saccostrea echinata TaxID=191078 RepID=UPI002A815D32|nr:E3 ubiquitin-protein ligase TRIM71-like [Saccostrea echinata]
MASSNPPNLDKSACALCSGKYKSPRCLPCSHSFCQDCLSSHIIDCCKSKDFPVGFNCPVCQVCIPSNGEFETPERWAYLFPVNTILMKLVAFPEQKHCAACKRDNEEVEAIDFCLACNEELCKTCSKCHRKGLTTRDHKMCSMNELQFQNSSHLSESNTCSQHIDRPVEFYCDNHGIFCCGLCGAIEHKKCENVCSIEEALEGLRKDKKKLIDTLQNNIETHEQQLMSFKQKEEAKITQLENISESVSTSFKQFRMKVEAELNKIEELGYSSLEKIITWKKLESQKYITSLSEKINCEKNVSTLLKEMKREEIYKDMLIKWKQASKMYEYIKKTIAPETDLIVETEHSQKLTEILDSLRHLSYPSECAINACFWEIRGKDKLGLAILNVDYPKIDREGKDLLNDGTFLPNGNIVMTGYCVPECYLFSNDFKFLKKIDIDYRPCDIHLKGEELFVSCPNDKSIQVLSLEDFKILRTIEIGECCYGLASFRDNLYAACYSSIIEFDDQGNILRTFWTESYVCNLIVNYDGDIIYSSSTDSHCVKSLSQEGNVLWTYRSTNLKAPYGLDIDSAGNIYVVGKFSQNIHILSKDFSSITVIENIFSPFYIKINESKQRCFVIAYTGALSEYDMRSSLKGRSKENA